MEVSFFSEEDAVALAPEKIAVVFLRVRRVTPRFPAHDRSAEGMALRHVRIHIHHLIAPARLGIMGDGY